MSALTKLNKALYEIKDLEIEEKFDHLITLRIKNRLLPSGFSIRLKNLFKNTILKQNLLRNPMYELLISNEMNHNEYNIFMTEYYEASCKLFISDVVLKAKKITKNEVLKNYLSDIYIEENTPRAHDKMLKEFCNEANFKMLNPTLSKEFTENQFKGFTSDIPYSLGYSLAIELEADYQIALVSYSLTVKFHHVVPAILTQIYFTQHAPSYLHSLRSGEQ